jgi:hypothetical protein
MSGAELDVLRGLVEPDGEGLRARPGSRTAQELDAAGLSGREARELLDKLRSSERPDFALDLTQMLTADEIAARVAEAVPQAST